MKIFGMGMPEFIIIVIAVFVLFGIFGKQLPKFGKSLGKTVSSLREGLNSSKVESKEDKKEEAEVIKTEASSDETKSEVIEESNGSEDEAPKKKVVKVVKQ